MGLHENPASDTLSIQMCTPAAFSTKKKGSRMFVLRWARVLALSSLCSWLTGCGVTTAPPPPPAPPTVSGVKSVHSSDNVIPISSAVIKQWVGIVLDAAEFNETPLRQVIVEQEVFEALWNSWRKGEEPPQVDFDSQFVVVVASREDTFAGLSIESPDAEGDAKLILPVHASPPAKGLSYAIAIIDRNGIKTIERKPIPLGGTP